MFKINNKNTILVFLLTLNISYLFSSASTGDIAQANEYQVNGYLPTIKHTANVHGLCSITFIVNPSRPNPRQREKLSLNFYFHTSFWRLKRLYEDLKGLKDLHKTFWGTTKKCENKNLKLIFILTQLSEMHGAKRVNFEQEIPTEMWKLALSLVIFFFLYHCCQKSQCSNSITPETMRKPEQWFRV